MSRLFTILLAALAVSCATKPELPYPSVQYKAPKGGKVEMYMISHASVAVCFKDFVIQVDPVGKMGQKENDYSVFPKADLILITHEHGDHYDPATIEALSKEGTVVLLNPATQAKFGKGEAIANWEKRKVGPVEISAVPAYNISEGSLNYHPKARGDNGYILDFNGFKVYFSGDTEDIEEMATFGPVDVAFLAANKPFTMSPDQCVNAAKTIQPKVLIPYHLSQTNMQEIKDKLDADNSGIEVLLFEELR